MEIEVWFVVHERKETDRKKQGSSFHIWRHVNDKTLFFCSIKIPPFFMSSMAALCRESHYSVQTFKVSSGLFPS
jgi:hypothetical protein